MGKVRCGLCVGAVARAEREESGVWHRAWMREPESRAEKDLSCSKLHEAHDFVCKSAKVRKSSRKDCKFLR